MIEEVWICPACGFQNKLGNLPEPHWTLNFCPRCKEKGKYAHMMKHEAYEAQKRKEELRKQIYCRNCGYMGPIESFPFNGPEDDIGTERECPACWSDNGINAADVRFCNRCNADEAVRDGNLCVFCLEEESAAMKASLAWMDKHID